MEQETRQAEGRELSAGDGLTTDEIDKGTRLWHARVDAMAAWDGWVAEHFDPPPSEEATE